MIKTIPPEIEANQTKRQTQWKMLTPPEVENIRFYPMSLDKPQYKPRPLNWHNKKNLDHQRNSSQSRGRNHPTEGHNYMENEHHDEANMDRNQSIETQNLFLSFEPRTYEQWSSTKEQGRENNVNNQWTNHRKIS
jgi:hypothetical protein